MKIKSILFARIGEALISLIIVIAVILLLSSCNPTTEINASFSRAGFRIITIDSCEYLYKENKYCITIAHKQNCKNHGK